MRQRKAYQTNKYRETEILMYKHTEIPRKHKTRSHNIYIQVTCKKKKSLGNHWDKNPPNTKMLLMFCVAIHNRTWPALKSTLFHTWDSIRENYVLTCEWLLIATRLGIGACVHFSFQHWNPMWHCRCCHSLCEFMIV